MAQRPDIGVDWNDPFYGSPEPETAVLENDYSDNEGIVFPDDGLGLEEDEETIEFNGSVLICINGEPYWINIPYDSDRGPYPVEEGPDFPIEEPEE